MIRTTLAVFVLLAAVATPGLAQDDAKIQQLEQRVASLESKLASIEKKLDEIAAGPEREKQAAAELTQIRNLVSAGKTDEAKAQLAEFRKKYGATQTAQRSGSFLREIDVIGKAAPASLEVEKWYVGDGVGFSTGKATLLVFFEEWCPHCKREVPKMQALHDSYKEKGLQVVGLTRITRSATEEKVRSFIQQNSLTYPIAKETGTMATHFGVSGIPAAAVVKDGKVVWRGHPARLTNAMLESWL